MPQALARLVPLARLVHLIENFDSALLLFFCASIESTLLHNSTNFELENLVAATKAYEATSSETRLSESRYSHTDEEENPVGYLLQLLQLVLYGKSLPAISQQTSVELQRLSETGSFSRYSCSREAAR